MSQLAINRKVWMSAGRGAVLPIATLLLVMLMVVPVPATLLDVGFITNIMISLAVLMVALNVAKPLDFSVLPDRAAVRDPAPARRSTSPRPASCWSTAMRARTPPATSSRRSAAS